MRRCASPHPGPQLLRCTINQRRHDIPFDLPRAAASRIALGVLAAALAFIAAALAFIAAALLHPVLWLFAGLVAVLGAGAITAPLEHGRRDHTASAAFLGA